MSHAFGIATKLKVKKSAPVHLINFLDYLYGLGEYKDESTRMPIHPSQLVTGIVEILRSALSGNSGYMPTWVWRVKEDHGEYWLYESRTASSAHGRIEFIPLINGIVEHLIIADGDIVYRHVYEESAVETVLYFNAGQFHTAEGHKYTSEQGYVTDWEHPYRDKLSAEDEQKIRDSGFDYTQRLEYGDHLLWTMEEYAALEAKAKRRQEREWKVRSGRGSYGFGD